MAKATTHKHRQLAAPTLNTPTLKKMGRAWRWNRFGLAMAAVFCLFAGLFPGLPVADGARRNAAPPAQSSDRRVSAERTGAVSLGGTHRLSLTADSGSVHIFTDATGEVRYRVRVEAEAADPDASQLLKQFSLTARGTSRGVELAGRM